MLRRIRLCPKCRGPINLFRTRPSPYTRLFSFRLYECTPCQIILETGEVVIRETENKRGNRYLKSEILAIDGASSALK